MAPFCMQCLMKDSGIIEQFTVLGMLEGCALTAAQPTGIPCLNVATKNGTYFKPCANDLLLLLIHGFVQHFLILYS